MIAPVLSTVPLFLAQGEFREKSREEDRGLSLGIQHFGCVRMERLGGLPSGDLASRFLSTAFAKGHGQNGRVAGIIATPVPLNVGAFFAGIFGRG